MLESPNMHDNGVLVEDIARKHEGKKYIIILDASGSTTINLVFYEKILKINLNQPIVKDFITLILF